MKHKNGFLAVFQKNSRSSVISSIHFHIWGVPTPLFFITKQQKFWNQQNSKYQQLEKI
jgi:hypothetical protein